MAQMYVKYNPYRMETQVTVNGNPISTDSILYKIVKGKRLQEWVGKFPQMLVEELNTVEFDIEFCGMVLDWDDFEDAFTNAQNTGVIKKLNLKFTEGKSDEDINEKIVNIFTDLQDGPVDDFREPKLIRAFANINNSIFPINVIATMSSGKSTLINALLGKKLMPSKNEACTATITEILDNDKEQFIATVYDEDNVVLQDVTWCSDEFAAETVDNVGEVSYEEKVYYEKVGQEEEQVVVGVEEVKVGTKKVKCGSHKEKTGTRTVRNPKKRWWKIFTPKYIEEDVYETVDDYKDEDVYETVAKYETVMRDIYEEHREQIEKFSVETAVIQAGLVSKLRRSLDEGIEGALDYAKEQIEGIKEQFAGLFDELDALIKEKYTELEECVNDQKTKEEELEKNKKLLKWIEKNKQEINSILDI